MFELEFRSWNLRTTFVGAWLASLLLANENGPPEGGPLL
jgi:hypothetical protein